MRQEMLDTGTKYSTLPQWLDPQRKFPKALIEQSTPAKTGGNTSMVWDISAGSAAGLIWFFSVIFGILHSEMRRKQLLQDCMVWQATGRYVSINFITFGSRTTNRSILPNSSLCTAHLQDVGLHTAFGHNHPLGELSQLGIVQEGHLCVDLRSNNHK